MGVKRGTIAKPGPGPHKHDLTVVEKKRGSMTMKFHKCRTCPYYEAFDM